MLKELDKFAGIHTSILNTRSSNKNEPLKTFQLETVL